MLGGLLNIKDYQSCLKKQNAMHHFHFSMDCFRKTHKLLYTSSTLVPLISTLISLLSPHIIEMCTCTYVCALQVYVAIVTEK